MAFKTSDVRNAPEFIMLEAKAGITDLEAYTRRDDGSETYFLENVVGKCSGTMMINIPSNKTRILLETKVFVMDREDVFSEHSSTIHGPRDIPQPLSDLNGEMSLFIEAQYSEGDILPRGNVFDSAKFHHRLQRDRFRRLLAMMVNRMYSIVVKYQPKNSEIVPRYHTSTTFELYEETESGVISDTSWVTVKMGGWTLPKKSHHVEQSFKIVVPPSTRPLHLKVIMKDVASGKAEKCTYLIAHDGPVWVESESGFKITNFGVMRYNPNGLSDL
ncbi:hypothetical protein RF11_12828 [Thelohanellus kitauei]|uniref:Uncharacterized protein n=1 Tax=Thelohanellus kitauei TaxID=669202 RepID=A0A0C2I845_THEKT|nr:hypothetical protein RF11_12828 [Thelohanellus kitauei]